MRSYDEAEPRESSLEIRTATVLNLRMGKTKAPAIPQVSDRAKVLSAGRERTILALELISHVEAKRIHP